MQVQVLLSMWYDCLSKEEARKLLDKWVHMVTTTQELRHSTRKNLRLAGDYLGGNGSIIQAMATWPCHIDCFGWQYDKAFSGNRLFGSNIMDCIQKRFQVFLHIRNRTYLYEIDTSTL